MARLAEYADVSVVVASTVDERYFVIDLDVGRGLVGAADLADQVELLAAAASELPAGRPRRATDASHTQYRLVVAVLAYCGLRWSELAGLKAGRIDLLRRRVEIIEAVTEVDGGELAWGTPKTHDTRWVPLPASSLTTSPRTSRARRRTTSRSPRQMEACCATAMRGAGGFDRAACEIGVAGLTPHELRHTAASLAVSAGANVKAVQRMLGHASAVMTLDRYADLFDDDLEAVGDRLDAVRAAAVARALPDAEVRDLRSAPRKAVGQ